MSRIIRNAEALLWKYDLMWFALVVPIALVVLHVCSSIRFFGPWLRKVANENTAHSFFLIDGMLTALVVIVTLWAGELTRRRLINGRIHGTRP